MTESLYERLLEARIRMWEDADQGSRQYQQANADMWSAILEAVSEHRSKGTQIPQEMAFVLEHELSYWVSGVPSDLLPLLTSRGRKISPVVRSCQLTAVMYLVASPELTGDRRFRKTVQEHYQIADSTLQRWKNKFSDAASASLAGFRIDLANKHRASLLKSLLSASARQYRALIKRPKPKRRSDPHHS